MVGGAGGSHYSGFLPRLRIPYMSTVGERVMGKECFGFRIGCLGRGPQCICTVRERTGLSIFTKHTQCTSRHMWQRFGPAADTLHSRIARSTLGCRPHACVTLFPPFCLLPPLYIYVPSPATTGRILLLQPVFGFWMIPQWSRAGLSFAMMFPSLGVLLGREVGSGMTLSLTLSTLPLCRAKTGP